MSTSTLTQLEPTRVELIIPIPSDEMRAAEDRAFRRLAKNAKVPGFRPGKVPRKLFEQTYGTQQITDEAMQDVVPAMYAKAVREHELEPVAKPEMELLGAAGDAPPQVKARVDVRPSFDLHQYKGLKLEPVSAEVSEDEVERTLRSLARDRAILVPVDRAARLGDVATIDYEGRIDGVPFEGGSAKGQQMPLEEERFIGGFAAGIAGMKPGETKEITATFPLEYQQSELAGKTAVFAVTVHELKEVEPPAIDDELARSVSEHQSIEALKSDIRRRLEALSRAKARRELGNQAVAQLVAAHDFPLPRSLVDREVDSMLSDVAQAAAQIGIPLNEYLEKAGKTEEGLREQYAVQAAERVKAMLLLDAIARAEELRATPADLKAEMESIARRYGQPVERVRATLEHNLGSVMEGIARNKAVEFIIDNANV